MIIIFTPFIAEGILRLLAWIGLAWMPFAAVVTGLAAQRKGHSSLRYAIGGATLSMLLFVPWAYLMIRLLNRSIPSFITLVGFILIYSAIIIGHAGSISVLFLVSEEADAPNAVMSRFGFSIFTAASISAAFLILATLWKQRLQSIAWVPVDRIILVARIIPFIIAWIGVIFFQLFFYADSPFYEFARQHMGPTSSLATGGV